MNAQNAKRLADDFNGRSESQVILDYIETAAKRGSYEITTYNMNSIVASSLKYALQGMGYQVEKCKTNLRSEDSEEYEYRLKIRWDNI